MILGVGVFSSGGRPYPVVPGDPYPDWCDRCMASSAVRIRFYVLRDDAGPYVVWPVGLAYACMVCSPESFGMDGPWGDGDDLVPA